MALYDYERQQYQQPRKPVSNDELFRQMQAQAFGNQNTSQPVEESSGLRRFVGDPLVSLGRGVIGAGEGFVGLANIPTSGYAGKALTDLTGYDPAEAKRSLATLYTPEQQQAFQEVEAAEGFLPTLKSMVQRPSTISHNVIESVPSMVGGSLIGRKALQYAPGIATALGSRAGMLAGAAGEGAMTAGQIAETARQQSDDGLINFKQAGQSVAGGIGTGALGVVGNALGGKLANKLGVDITDIDTAFVTGKLASSGNIGKRLIAGGISEGVFEELPQSVQEQMWTNAATGKDLYEGVQEAAATGLLTGAAMGAGSNVFSGQNVEDTKKEKAKPPREQLLNVDKQIFDLEQNTQTPESQQTLNTLYGQRDELLKNIRGITNTPVTKYEQPLSDDIDTISRQITNLEASGRDTVGTRELLQDLYGQKEILAKRIEDAPWIETEREIARQQRVRDYQNKLKSIESDETLNEEDKTNQINLLTQQYQQDYKPRDFASEARKTMQKSVEKLTTGTFIPADQNELDMAMDDLMAQYEELAREEEDIKKSEEIINNQKRVLGLSKQVDVLKEIQPLKDRAKVENIFNDLMIKENQTGLTDQEKKTLTNAKAKLTKDNNRIEKVAKLNQEMSQLFTDTDETLMGRFQRDFDIQRQESQEQQDYKNTLYDNAINFVTSQNKISPRGLMGQFDLTYPEAQELLKNMEAEGIVGQSGKANIRNVNKVSEVRSNIEQPLVSQITEQEQPGLEEQPIQQEQQTSPVQQILPVQPDMQGQQIVQDVPEMSNEKSTFTDEQSVEQTVNQQQEQPVEQTLNTEQPTITKPVESVEDPLIAVQEDIQARQDNISALKEELEANKLEQSRMDINDPMLEELRLDEQAINEQIKEANRELAIVRIIDGKGKFESRETQEPTKSISLSDIKKNFKTEEVSQDENGSISVKFKNGKGITFNSVQDAGNGFIQFAINTGQLSKNGKILGVTTGSNVLLDKDFADNKTVWHETFHVFKNLNMINDAEYRHLVKDFNKLRKAGKLQFSLSTHEDPMAALEENLANSFAQVMTSREDYRNTALGKMIQRIMDFMKKMFSFGQQSLSGFAKEVETGKIYDREISDLKTGTAMPNFQSIGNTNSEEFKNWFGKSAAKTKDGEPVVFYHGTPNNFTVFENLPGQSTLHATSGLGHFFTMDKNYAEAYSKETGNVMSVYLKMEKPYKMSLEEAQSYETVLDAKVAQRLLKRKGYDSVIISVPGSQPMITIFNSNQIKSINNQGTWDINNPDIRFEVREKLGIPEQDIPQAEYDKMRQENKDLIGKTKQFLRSKGHEVNREMNKYLGVTSTNLAKIHPMLRAKVRRLDFDTLQRIHSNLNIALPVLEAVKKMSSNERSDFDWAVKNGDSGKILSLTGKYNFTEQYNALRAMLDQTHEDLKDVGYKPGFVDTYWPRLMKDREGFLQATREISRDPVFTQALQDKASKLGKTIEQLDPDVRADIIAQKIMEIKSGMGGPANIQGRIFDKIPIDLGKYYMDSSAALVQYIYSTAKNIEARKFFGKVPTKISNAKSIVRQNNDKLNKLQNTAGLLASQDRDTTDIDLQIKEVKDNIKLHEKVIEEYGQTRDFTDNIGSYIDEIRASQLIPEKKFQENEGILKDILSARFHERGTSGIANIYKNVSLLDTMGSPLAALTQIPDLGWSIYVGGLTPRGITNTVKNIGKAIAKRSDITKEDFGLEWIAQEFADADTLSSVVNKTFKLIGLNYVDSIGKESLINNAYDNYRVKAKDKPKLFKEIRHMFNSDKETNQVIEDLQNNVRDSKDVQFLTFSRLLDFQPAAKSEMPEKMLTAGNWRLAYLLKTFTIKQFDVFRNEVWYKLKSGDKGQVIEGLRNMAYLTSIMTLSGAGADELKDFILGKETRFEDHVIENFLTLGGANRYIRMQVNREGIGTALGKQVLPPFKFIDNIYKDISQDVTDLHSARFVDSIPVVGKLYYWHLGRGAKNKESIAEQDFKKLGKDVREFKKRLENNTDKRSFVQANISEYRQMKRHENVQGNLNKYTALINKLKKVPQTENVKRRINQLEERKEQIMTRYFM